MAQPALAGHGVDCFSLISDLRSEICGSVGVSGRWADELASIFRACWPDLNPGSISTV